MRHPFFASSRPRVFAHRGGSALAPENTSPRSTNGLALGPTASSSKSTCRAMGWVVRASRADADRTTALRGPIANRTADELRRAAIPSLTDVLARYRDARIIIEMKVNTEALATATVDALRRAAAVERVCLGSFGWRVLHAARGLEPRVATSAAREEVRWALYRSWCRWPVSRVAYAGYQVPEWSGHTRVVSPRFVEGAHRAGLGVQVWTVDTEEDARRLIAWGVDALITDRPEPHRACVSSLRAGMVSAMCLDTLMVSRRTMRSSSTS